MQRSTPEGISGFDPRGSGTGGLEAELRCAVRVVRKCSSVRANLARFFSRRLQTALGQLAVRSVFHVAWLGI
jgi:hypothetical protein